MQAIYVWIASGDQVDGESLKDFVMITFIFVAIEIERKQKQRLVYVLVAETFTSTVCPSLKLCGKAETT